MKISKIKAIDAFLGPVISVVLFPLRLFSKKLKNFNKKNILFLQFWGVGETILTLPAIESVKKKYPDSKITILVTPRSEQVYRGISFIDEIKVIDTTISSILRFALSNFRKYDLAIDFEEYLNISSIIASVVSKGTVGYSTKRSSFLFTLKTPYNDKQHVVQTHLDLSRLVGADGSYDKLIPLVFTDSDSDYIKSLLAENNLYEDDILLGICVGAAESARSRMWIKQNFAETADRAIRRYGLKVVFVGSSNEKDYIKSIQKLMKQDSINLAGKTTLKQLFCLISKCSIFLSNDTGPMHIAAAQGCRTIGLFGPNLPVRWGPYGPGNISIYKGRVCKHSPCINVHLGQTPECLIGNNKCMKAITVDDVIDAVDLVMKDCKRQKDTNIRKKD